MLITERAVIGADDTDGVCPQSGADAKPLDEQRVQVFDFGNGQMFVVVAVLQHVIQRFFVIQDHGRFFRAVSFCCNVFFNQQFGVEQGIGVAFDPRRRGGRFRRR